MKSPTFRVLDAVGAVTRTAWDALLDPLANPFVSWTFLDALETSGCAGPGHGWRPRHLTLWRDDTLVAAAPAYLKFDHEGDFARDWVWSSAVERAGVRYFPRLLVTVPITPVPGRRFLVAPGEDRAAAVKLLVEGAQRLARDERASSVHVLYALDTETEGLAELGLASRVDFQAHWVNRGYASTDDFLTRGLDSKQRRNARVERAKPGAQGITIRTVRGAELAADRDRWGRLAHSFYHATVDGMRWGRPWLNAELFARIFHDHARAARARRRQPRRPRRRRRLQRPARRPTLRPLLGVPRVARRAPLQRLPAPLHRRLHRAGHPGLRGRRRRVSTSSCAASISAPTLGAHWFANARINKEIAAFLAEERRARADELSKWHHTHDKADDRAHDKAHRKIDG